MGTLADKDYTTSRYMGISWDMFHRDARALAAKLMAKGPFRGIVAITRGGLVPAAVVARELNLRMIETLCISSYDDRVQGSGVSVLKRPEGDGEGLLVIDDLVDSGRTGKVVRELLPKAYFATVYAKPQGREVVDDFVVGVDQGIWLLFPWDADLQPAPPLVKGG
ncbi:guanine-hypoxanthine phosphoribosyltransferase [uncultured Alphaproteobacteria bacterium]|uniref:Xanthine-guanine phosphoribosyltransferase n=1 Tax=uncultured Alphaproteobacteria bacterium TaxID=91750 RepID=A0A212KIU4_9PROT|nr:guanine-hypoxanthine phosphoribosyltransferase [uncultured Alphaproteobacteria bacterium]